MGVREKKREAAFAEALEKFNAEVPPGTKVRYWPLLSNGQFGGVAIDTKTRSEAWALGHGEGVVQLEGKSGGHAINHLEVL